MLPPQNEWQIMDKELNLLYPWYTSECIGYLKDLDFSDKWVLEWGAGHSTLWWEKKTDYVESFETNYDFFCSLANSPINEAHLYINYVEDKDDYFPSDIQDFDIIVIDGEWRDECCIYTLNNAKPGTMVICDNWMQPEVWMAGEHVREQMLKKEHKIFKQPGHPTWQTAIFWI